MNPFWDYPSLEATALRCHRLVLAIIALSVIPLSHAADKKRPPPFVEVTTVQPAQLPQSLSAVATLKANESIALKSEVTGRVVSIGFEEGQSISKGQVLVKLDDALLQADLANAKATLSLAEAEFQRYQALVKEKQVAELDFERKQAELAQAKAALALVQAKLKQLEIRAPFAGVIGLRQFSIGDVVQPNQSLVTLTSLSPLKVDIRLPESTAGQLHLQQAVAVKIDALPDLALSGRLVAIEPSLDNSTRAIVVRALVNHNDKRIRAGMTAHVNLQLGAQAGVIVPEQALVAQNGKLVIFTVKDNVATATPVQTGGRQVGKVLVTQGLKAGDTVVVSGQNKIAKPQMPINPVPYAGGTL